MLIKYDHKAGSISVFVVAADRGEFEVTVPSEKLKGGGYRSFKYTVIINTELQPTDVQLPFTVAMCTCRKTQLTGILCSHLVAVCKHLRYDINIFIDTRYSTSHLLKTWSGQFHFYGDEDTWPVVTNRPKIIPDKTKINHGRRRGICLPITMDEMERKNAKRRQARKRSKTSTSKTPRPEEPLPMAALQSNRCTSIPPSSSSIQSQRTNVQPSRLSLNVDPMNTNNTAENLLQPRRALVSVGPRRINTVSTGIRAESARFSSRPTSIGEGSGEGNRERREKGICGKIRRLFSRGRYKK